MENELLNNRWLSTIYREEADPKKEPPVKKLSELPSPNSGEELRYEWYKVSIDLRKILSFAESNDRMYTTIHTFWLGAYTINVPYDEFKKLMENVPAY